MLDRPERLNALSTALWDALIEAFLDAQADPDVRVVVVAGAGERAFCSGFDLKDAQQRDAEGKPFRGPMDQAKRLLFEVVHETGKPTIAAVNGVAAGAGCELALACDIRCASPNARFALPEAKVGMGGIYGSVVLPRVIPVCIALEMMYPGDFLPAAEARHWGLVNRVVEDQPVLQFALAEAARIAALGAIFLAVGEQPVAGPLLNHAVTVPLLRAVANGANATRLDAALDGAALIGVAQDLPGTPADAPHRLRITDGALHGTAELVPFGQWARDLVVVAHDTTHGDTVIALLDAARTRRTPVPSVDPCTQYCRVDFDAVPLAADAVLLRGREASTLLARCADLQRLMIAAELAGGAQQMVGMSVEYAKTRRQFGRAIGSFQALQHMLAEMTAKAAALSSMVLATLDDAAAKPARAVELGMLAKAQACINGRELSQEALQVHGGIGFTADLALHLYMRRVFTHQGFLGESDDLLRELGARMLAEKQWR